MIHRRVLKGTHGHQKISNSQAATEPLLDSAGNAYQTDRPKVAYLMSRFPKITETFILYEMLAIEQQGIAVEVYPLLREHTNVIHPEAIPYVERALFHPIVSREILWANLSFLRRKPGTYVQTLSTLVRANWGSRRFLSRALGLFPKAVYFAHTMAAEGVTHVHAHFASHPAAAAFVIHRLADIPYSFTAHGSDLHRDRHMLSEKVAEAAFVVAISDYNRDMIVSECNDQYQEKILTIHCGVDLDIFKPHAEPTPYEQGTGPFAIFCTGTLHEVKGQTYLIEACRLLQEDGIDFVCHLVGDGPDFAALTKQVKQANLAERVHFHGRLTRKEIAALLGQVDVVATPSVPTSNGRREGIPVVLMEAMSSGVPVVASGISGIPELVEHGRNGFLTPARDARALANALRWLQADAGLRQRLGRAGRRKVAQEFDLYNNAATLAQHILQEARA